MAFAVRVSDPSTHGGIVVGPGVATVLIKELPAAVLGDLHVCALPPIGHQPTASPFTSGSAQVFIGGRPALRTSDACACGATAALGEPSVEIS